MDMCLCIVSHGKCCNIAITLIATCALLLGAGAQKAYANPAASSDKPHADHNVEEDQGESPPKRILSAPSYVRWSVQAKALCRELQHDGRDQKFAHLMGGQAARDASCPACRPLFDFLRSACEVKKKAAPRRSSHNTETQHSETKGDAHATVGPNAPQREPRVDALVQAIALAHVLASDKKSKPLTDSAIARMLMVLRTSLDATKGERDYFTLLAAYFEEAYLANDEEEVGKEGHGTAAPMLKPTASADDFFGAKK